MSLTVDAIYENGVLKPTQPIALAEGTRVSVVITTPAGESLGQSPAAILAAIAASPLEDLDAETDEWLDADLVEDLPPYDWGKQGIPPGKQVNYAPGVGFVVEGGKALG
jgi:predicted DNA-binding antitoxin AbrB/MazE fold protein